MNTTMIRIAFTARSARRTLLRGLVIPTTLAAIAACEHNPIEPDSLAAGDALLARGGAKPAPAAGTLAFAGNLGGTNIFRVVEGGIGLSQLTVDGKSHSPAWSPTYDRIAFVRDWRIWTMKPDGTGEVQITHATPGTWHEDMRPTWSPDGARIAFLRSTSREIGGEPETVYDVYVVTVQTGAVQRVTSLEVRYHTGMEVDWSPDGKRILFSRHTAQGLNLFSVTSAGAQLQQMTSCTTQCISGRYSPDGKTIIFVEAGNRIARIPAKGGARTTVFQDVVPIATPAFSPNGTEIAFQRYHASAFRIWKITASGQGLTRATGMFFTEMTPAWAW